MENDGGLTTGPLVDGVEVPVLNLQPLVDRVAESASIESVVLILIIVFLIGIVISERSRNGTLTRNYMSQSIQVVQVLTSVKELMDRNVRYLEINEAAVRKVAERIHEIATSINILLPNKAKPRRTRKAKSDPEAEPADEGRST